MQRQATIIYFNKTGEKINSIDAIDAILCKRNKYGMIVDMDRIRQAYCSDNILMWFDIFYSNEKTE